MDAAGEGAPSAGEGEGGGEQSAAPDSVVTVTGDENPDAQPASGEAQVREPARVPRYMSRRMRRKGGKDQGQGRSPEPRPGRDGQGREDQGREDQGREGQGRESRPESPARTHRGGGQPLISELLKEGQEIIVQIAKEPMGKKGARITSHIALPGRYLVYMPTVDHVGVSRRISSDEERQRLKRVLTEFRKSLNMPGGFIVRTAAEGRSDEDLRNDVRFLFNLWRECKAQAEKKSAPSLLHRDLNLVERILRDQISMSFSNIWVDYEPEYAKMVDFLELSQPALAARVKLYLKDTPIFEEFGIQEQINNSLKSKVWLKSGGYIVINQTEALVAIDVNTGKYVGRTQRLEDTIVKTNTDAIKEIVRQIRLRDLGGIIVIDFIDMDERKNRQKVMQALEDALRQDRAPSKALAFNDFGLVAITRKRVKQPLEKALGCVCPYCTGSGFVKSPQTVSLEILAEAKKLLTQLERNTITLRVNPEVARYLKQNATLIKEMEELAGGRPILVKGDISLHQENFDFH
jgi:ribonuclease G